MYAPLADGITEVTVGCDASKDTAKLTVQRGPPPHPSGTPEIPILGRVLTYDRTDPKDTTPMIFTIHGVRRLEGATAIYLSYAGQEGAAIPNPYSWTYSDGILKQTFVSFGLLGTTHLVDHPDLVGWSSISNGTGPLGSQLYQRVMAKGNAGVTWTILPPLPAGVTEVDVIVAGRYFLSVPVLDGPMTPVSAEQYVAFGAGWPAIPSETVAKATPDQITLCTANIRDNETTKSITKTGRGNVDLDANVLFDYNKSTLTSKAAAVLATAAADIQASGKTGQLTVTGYTDSDGSGRLGKVPLQSR